MPETRVGVFEARFHPIQSCMPPDRISVFLSYARGDDESFVKTLYKDLTEHGFQVWFDRVSMPSRKLAFLQEIADAIRRCDKLILVIGPKALNSAYVKQEWEYAWAMESKVVVPIIRLGALELIPDGIGLLEVHIEDFRSPDPGLYLESLSLLMQNLREAPPATAPLFGVPSMPVKLVSRHELVDLATRHLLKHIQETGVAVGRKPPVALVGFGGTGKSVIATSIAVSRRIRQAFSDGVIWMRFGRVPAVGELVRQVMDILGVGNFNVTSPQQAKAMLRRIVNEKAMLFIFDDLWNAADYQIFDLAGPRCEILITTRDGRTAERIGATIVRVPCLGDAESLALVGEIVGKAPVELSPSAHQVLQFCGGHPLAISVCARLANGDAGVSWEAILDSLRQGRLTSLSLPDDPDSNVGTVIDSTVGSLSDAGQRRWADLSVFPKGREIPEVAIMALWALDESGNLCDRLTRERFLFELSEMSLVSVSTARDTETQLLRRKISVHDLVLMRAEAAQSSAVDAHRRLIDGFQRLVAVGETDEDTPYFRRHLPLHLCLAGRSEDAIQLILHGDVDYLQEWVDHADENVGLKCLAMLENHANQVGDRHMAAGFATQAARILFACGRSEAAKTTLLSRVLPGTSIFRSRRLRAIGFHELGSALLGEGRFSGALSEFRKALRLCRLGGRRDRDELSANYLGMSTALLHLCRYRQARRLAGRGLRISRSCGDLVHEIAAFRIRGTAQYYLGDYRDAIKDYDSAHDLAAREWLSTEWLRVELARFWLATVPQEVSHVVLPDPLSIASDAVVFAEKSGAWTSVLQARLCLAFAESLAGNSARAISLAKTLEEDLSVSPIADVSAGTGVVFSSGLILLGELAEAEDVLNRVVQLCCRFGLRQWKWRALLELGFIRQEQNRPAEAASLWREAEGCARSTSRARGQLAAYLIGLRMQSGGVKPREDEHRSADPADRRR